MYQVDQAANQAFSNINTNKRLGKYLSASIHMSQLHTWDTE